MPINNWITVNHACDKAGVSRRTIYNWIKRELLTTKRTASGSYRILEESLWRPDTGGQPVRRPV